MRKSSPFQLAEDLIPRSVCRVQTTAVLFDRWGVFSWGWNHMGADGLGEHAEVNAIRRANRQRLAGASIVVMARRKRNGKIITALPCSHCVTWLTRGGIRTVWVQAQDGTWQRLRL